MKGISKQLQDSIPKLKPGETVIFEVKGIRFDKVLKKFIIPNSVSVPNTDRIFDPWANNGDGAYVDLNFVVSERPAPLESQRETIKELGTIYFQRNEGGRIIIKGGNKKDEVLLEHLWLTNFNESNVGEKFHIRPSKYIFKRLDPKQSSKEFLKGRRAIRAAEDAVDEMGATKLREIAKGLSLPGINEHSDPETIREQLVRRAEKNPESILKLDSDVGIQYIAMIKDAEKAGIITKDLTNSVWKWGDNGENLCVHVPGKSPEESLKDFFLSENGEAALNVIESQINPKPSSSPAKVQKRPAKRKN